jgi:hypothetical protein
MKPSKTGQNPEILHCRKSNRFENIIVCTINCLDRCYEYQKRFDIEIIKNYILKNTDYEMKGVIMPTTKKDTTPKQSVTKEKTYWIISEGNVVLEVPESEVRNNPAEYIGKPMFEKPKDEYEVIVTIKKKAVGR